MHTHLAYKIHTHTHTHIENETKRSDFGEVSERVNEQIDKFNKTMKTVVKLFSYTMCIN